MSQRSIVEINHDQMSGMKVGELEMLLLAAVASGSDRMWEPLKRFGIRRIVQVHHSAECKVVTGGKDYDAIA